MSKHTYESDQERSAAWRAWHTQVIGGASCPTGMADNPIPDPYLTEAEIVEMQTLQALGDYYAAVQYPAQAEPMPVIVRREPSLFENVLAAVQFGFALAVIVTLAQMLVIAAEAAK